MPGRSRRQLQETLAISRKGAARMAELGAEPTGWGAPLANTAVGADGWFVWPVIASS
jgi:hypothetical protein